MEIRNQEDYQEEEKSTQKEPDLGSEEALNRPIQPYHEEQEKVREAQQAEENNS